MATRAKVTLKYSDLKTLAINKILAACQNISGRSNIPDCMRKGYVKQFKHWTGGTNFILSDSTAVYDVTEQTVRNTFDQFLTACGIDVKSNQVPTTRGLINFWNNVSSFCTSYVRIAVGGYPESSPPSRIVFDTSVNMSSASPTILDREEETITADDVNKLMSYTKRANANASKIKAMVYSMQSFCSCSSSSSSSSCSSSIFIGYMKLGE